MEADTIADIAKAARKINWELHVIEDRIFATDGAQAIGLYVELDEPLIDDEFKVKTEELYRAFKAMDGDVEITESDDEAYIVVTDGSTTVELRKRTVGDSGFAIDPTTLLDKPELETILDVSFDSISDSVGSGQKITGTDATTFEADDNELVISFDSKGSSYETTLSLDSQAFPSSSMYDAKLLKKLDKAVYDDESIKMGDDFPMVVESSLNDARVLSFIAPKIPE